MVDNDIRCLFKNVPDILYGYADIKYSPYYNEYKSALVFAVPYGRQVTIETYKEINFEQGINHAKKRLEKLLFKIEDILKKNNISYYIPPVAQTNEEDLIAPFSFKFAAVNAGLGWIGKNDVLITERYGPRVRLSAILIDKIFKYDSKIIQSKCPKNCRRCIDICPCGALHNVNWDIDKLRDEIIDYQLCNQRRSEYIKKHGRKNSCGLCMAVCPVGISGNQNE